MSARTLALAAVLACACGEPMPDESRPFGGREITFRSYYVHFPSSFGFTLVRDSMPQEEVCPIYERYRSVPLPYKEEHYALVITIQSATAGDDVTVDLNDRGPAGDLRSIGLGHYPVGARTVPPGGYGVDAGGVVRIRELIQGRRVAGSYTLRFRTGEMLSGDFDVSTCPSPTR